MSLVREAGDEVVANSETSRRVIQGFVDGLPVTSASKLRSFTVA
jgi:hypothetical protein